MYLIFLFTQLVFYIFLICLIKHFPIKNKKFRSHILLFTVDIKVFIKFKFISKNVATSKAFVELSLFIIILFRKITVHDLTLYMIIIDTEGKLVYLSMKWEITNSKIQNLLMKIWKIWFLCNLTWFQLLEWLTCLVYFDNLLLVCFKFT